MITLIKDGKYRLIETKHDTKVLYLDDDTFAWIEPPIGEILVTAKASQNTDCVLSIGKYRLYGVRDEPYFSDNQHLELEVGENVWQGYLLLTGLPRANKKRSRIIPTPEIITGNNRARVISKPKRYATKGAVL